MKKLLETNQNSLIILLLTIGVFGIINTEMGVIGIIPLIATTFNVTVPEAAWTVSTFAVIVALAAPVMPLLFSGFNRKHVMLLALGVFILSNIVSIFTSDFTVILIARAVPAFFHPIYVSMAFSVAAASVSKAEAPKAVSKIFIGVSAGMVLGVPVTSFIASETSFAMAMVFFAVVNALVFIGTLVLVPSLPVKENLSYGAQLAVLKRAITWNSIIAVTLANAAMFGFFSFMSDYLKTVTVLSYRSISVMLLIYGLANIFGNIAAGKLLSINAARTVKGIPFVMIVIYIGLFLLGDLTVPMGIILFVLGVLAGIASNNSQYMISNAAPEAPDFANGLFLSSANLGTTIGTAVCGLFISGIGTRYSVIGAVLFTVLSILFIFLRYRSKSGIVQDAATDPQMA
jgi:DHA1 family inner membrane transport protein